MALVCVYVRKANYFHYGKRQFFSSFAFSYMHKRRRLQNLLRWLMEIRPALQCKFTVRGKMRWEGKLLEKSGPYLWCTSSVQQIITWCVLYPHPLDFERRLHLIWLTNFVLFFILFSLLITSFRLSVWSFAWIFSHSLPAKAWGPDRAFFRLLEGKHGYKHPLRHNLVTQSLGNLLLSLSHQALNLSFLYSSPPPSSQQPGNRTRNKNSFSCQLLCLLLFSPSPSLTHTHNWETGSTM